MVGIMTGVMLMIHPFANCALSRSRTESRSRSVTGLTSKFKKRARSCGYDMRRCVVCVLLLMIPLSVVAGANGVCESGAPNESIA